MEEGTQSWWIAILFGVLPLLVWILWSWNELWFLIPLKAHSGSTKLPPGHMGLPFIGEMLSFLWYFNIVRRPDDFITSKRNRYGDGVGMYRTYLFGSPSIIGCSPAFNKYVLQSSDLFQQKWPSTELFGLHALAIVEGKPHTRLRSYLTNAINRPDALKKITTIIQPHIVSSLRSWAEKGRITFENISNMFVSFKPGPILDVMDQYFSGLLRGVRAQPSKIPGTAFYHAFQCRKKLDAIFREELEKRKQSGSMSKDKNDLMEGLMVMRDEEGKLLGDDEVLDNMITLLFGGYESTSTAIMWALYYLGKHHDVVQKIREEILALGKKGDYYITSEDLAQLKYTNKVVEETLRMANISPFFFREVKEDTSYQGYKIPKGWNIILWTRYLHTDAKNFDDPMNFNPERWNEPPKPGTNQVFGAGMRFCPGNTLARLQIAIFIYHLVPGYTWELINPDAKIKYLPHPALEDGLKIAFSTIGDEIL
ncbi:hypothetical protein IFM89_025044 [Coptis chinensis]|uniref:Cytochrome P450 n=1 Tax=Coptis chinensis TaxID=261450 RepID=A0A835H0T7_9MAGN|nr:hypothetical protein IFM89_025044 [Coptis chinensis]